MTQRAVRLLGLLLVVFASLEAFLLTSWTAREVLARLRLAEWSTRPEIENWADPYYGADWLPVAVGAGLLMLLVGGATVVLATRRRVPLA